MTNDSTASVLIADDHPVYGESIGHAITRDPRLELVDVVRTGECAVGQALAARPDVMLLDVLLPDCSGIDVLHRLREAGSETRAVMLSAIVDPAVVHTALVAGAAGFLGKERSRQVLCDTLAEAAAGELVLTAEVRASLTDPVLGAPSPIGSLTPRELDVLQLLTEGHRAPAIGRLLGVGTSTVKSHLNSLFEKLGVHDRAAAVYVAIRHGLIS